MTEIYSNASEVIILIGTHSIRMDAFLDYMVRCDGRLPRAMEDEREQLGMKEFFGHPYWNRACKSVYLGAQLVPHQDLISTKVESILGVIQEIAMSRRLKVLCGGRTFSWESFMELFRFDLILKADPNDGRHSVSVVHRMRMIDELRKINLGHLNPMPFIHILHETRTAGSADPRDAVYAKLGLASEVSELVPQPDYNLPVELLFKTLTKNAIERDGPYVICLTEETTLNLPSWVPDWNSTQGRRSLVATEYQKHVHAVWCGQSVRQEYNFSESLDELWLSGVCVDTIGPYRPDADKRFQFDQSAWNIFPSICATIAPTRLGAFLEIDGACDSRSLSPHVFALRAAVSERVYSGGYTPITVTDNESNFPELPSMIEGDGMDFDAWWTANRGVVIGEKSLCQWLAEYLTYAAEHRAHKKWNRKTKRGKQQGRTAPNSVHASNSENDTTRIHRYDLDASFVFCRRLAVNAWKRQLTGTVAGRPILAPDAAIEGDLVVLLYSCPVPVVLRRCEDFYTLVGECCVASIQDWEFARTFHCYKDREMVFNIR